jgi:hypothetical protein
MGQAKVEGRDKWKLGVLLDTLNRVFFFFLTIDVLSIFGFRTIYIFFLGGVEVHHLKFISVIEYVTFM